jgi:hypothetical protein
MGMTTYYVTHTDAHGERHQIGDAFEAKTPEDAICTILQQSGAEDDGKYEVFEADMRTELEQDVRTWANCREAHVDVAGDIWIAYPQRGHWLSPERKAEFYAWHKAWNNFPPAA